MNSWVAMRVESSDQYSDSPSPRSGKAQLHLGQWQRKGRARFQVVPNAAGNARGFSR